MRLHLVLTVAIAAAVPLAAPPADAAFVLCQNKSGKKIKIRLDECKKKETRVSPVVLGASSPYGDGSAGPLVVDDTQHLTDLVPDGNLQFTDITIGAGGYLVVPTGTVLRAFGSFVNDGTVEVQIGAGPGSLSVLTPASQVIPRRSTPDAPGVGGTARGPGATVNGTGWEAGGASGLGDHARLLLQPGRLGGGAGSLSQAGGSAHGGGALTILASGSLTNNGTILAEGSSGGGSGAGGGGGGFVVLASRAEILHSASATISTTGGAGGSSGDSAGAGALPEYVVGPGGGGGGGCVHLLAPNVTNAGTVEIAGGNAGTPQTVTLRSLRVGGGGGGASCGGGGGGGRISGSTTPGDADPGTDGKVFVTLADPTGMF